MSVLETFIVLFKGDTTDLKKGSVDAKKTTDDLNKSLVTTNSLTNKVGDSFTSMIRSASNALLALFGVGAVIGGLKYASTFADQIGELSDALDVDVESLSAWGDAVKMSGGSAEGFQETVKAMTAALADFATKGTSRAAPFFQELGVKMTDASGRARNFLDVLPEIASSFERLSKSESFGIGRKMGLDQGTIMLLQRGRSEVEAFVERQKELGVITEEDSRIAAKFNDQWDDTVHAFRSLAVAGNSVILPVLKAVLRTFEHLAIFLREHPTAIKAIALGLGALATYFAPIATLIAGVSTAFFLLYDDIDHFRKGHQSLIGDMLKKWPQLLPVIQAIGTVFKVVFAIAETGLKVVVHLFQKLFEAVNIIGDAFVSLVDIVRGVWTQLVGIVESSIATILAAVEKIAKIYENVKEFLGFGNTDVSSAIKVTQQTIDTANRSPFNALSTNTIANTSNASNRNMTVNIGDVTVETQANNSDQIAASFSKSLNAEMRQAANYFDDGVLA